MIAKLDSLNNRDFVAKVWYKEIRIIVIIPMGVLVCYKVSFQRIRIYYGRHILFNYTFQKLTVYLVVSDFVSVLTSFHQLRAKEIL